MPGFSKIQYCCLRCGAKGTAPADLRGKLVQCPRCSAPFRIETNALTTNPEEETALHKRQTGAPKSKLSQILQLTKRSVAAIFLGNALITILLLGAWVHFTDSDVQHSDESYAGLDSTRVDRGNLPEPQVIHQATQSATQRAKSYQQAAEDGNTRSSSSTSSLRPAIPETAASDVEPVNEFAASPPALADAPDVRLPTDRQSLRTADALQSADTSVEDDGEPSPLNVEESVVRLETQAGSGSGFIVDGERIVTAYHVIEGATKVKIVFAAGGATTSSGWLAIEPKRDLAVISFKSPVNSSAPLRISEALPAKMTQVFAFGAPLGLQGSVSDGIVSAVRLNREVGSDSLDPATRLIQTTAPISPGNSGGPLVDRSGRVVGVNSFRIVAGQNLNFAISFEYIEALLAIAAIQEKPWTALPAVRRSRHANAGDEPTKIAEAEAKGLASIEGINGSLNAVVAKGKALTEQVDALKAQATAVQTKGLQVEQRMTGLTQELDLARRELNWALSSGYYQEIETRRQQSERLEYELSNLRDQYGNAHRSEQQVAGRHRESECPTRFFESGAGQS